VVPIGRFLNALSGAREGEGTAVFPKHQRESRDNSKYPKTTSYQKLRNCPQIAFGFTALESAVLVLVA
jgi:hypothetical protein